MAVRFETISGQRIHSMGPGYRQLYSCEARKDFKGQKSTMEMLSGKVTAALRNRTFHCKGQFKKKKYLLLQSHCVGLFPSGYRNTNFGSYLAKKCRLDDVHYMCLKCVSTAMLENLLL